MLFTIIESRKTGGKRKETLTLSVFSDVSRLLVWNMMYTKGKSRSLECRLLSRWSDGDNEVKENT